VTSGDVFEILNETLLTEAWQNAKVGAVVFDDDRTFLTANQAYLELVGYSFDEIGRLKAGANLLADEEGRLGYLRLINRHERLHGSAPIRRKDGDVLMVDYFIVPTVVARLPYFIALMWPAESGRR
jgi:PAS domain S-box-containing protein